MSEQGWVLGSFPAPIPHGTSFRPHASGHEKSVAMAIRYWADLVVPAGRRFELGPVGLVVLLGGSRSDSSLLSIFQDKKDMAPAKPIAGKKRKYFTVEEANKALPLVRMIVGDIVRQYRVV